MEASKIMISEGAPVVYDQDRWQIADTSLLINSSSIVYQPSISKVSPVRQSVELGVQNMGYR